MTDPEKKPLKDAADTARRITHPVSIVERRMSKFLREPPSVRLAANVIVTATVIVVVLGGVMMRVVDHRDYTSVWLGMWWVLETVTTVGFGDFTPHNAIGKIVTRR